MKIEGYEKISPYVRMMRIKKALAMSGKWRDIDNVFTYIAQGSAEFIVDGKKYVLGVGDVIIIPPFKTHVVMSLGQEPLVQFIFHFDFFETEISKELKHQDILEQGIDYEIPKGEKLIGDQVVVSSLNENDRTEIKKLYLSMYKEFAEEKDCKDTTLKAYATLLLILCLRNGMQELEKQDMNSFRKTKSWVHIENAIAYINKHYMDEALSNETISYAIGVTPNYLTRVFGDYLGISLHRYIINLKVEKAQQMLTLGKMNITETAEKAGFSGIHAFSKTFKSVIGMTPSEYINYAAQKETIIPGNIKKKANDICKKTVS